jgi:hypothetical protein
VKRVLLGLVTLALAVGLLLLWSGLGAMPRASAQPTWDVNQCDDNVDNDADGAAFPGRVNDGCPAVGPAESGAQCNNAIDDDADTLVNDGCPIVGTQEEDSLQCGNGLDDDGDTVAEDGCGGANPPAAGPVGEPEVTDTCANATDDDDRDGKINDGCPAVGVAETGAQCDNAVDDGEDTPADGVVNDGCLMFNNTGLADGDDREAQSIGVGGVAELPALGGSAATLAEEGGGLSVGAYAALAAGAVSAALVLSAGAVYARRRWLS